MERKQNTTQSATEWLNFLGKLSSQRLTDQLLVVYNASGSDTCAARVNRNALPQRFVVDHKLYWIACRSVVEADFLTAFLNARHVNERIKPF